ncbi:patronin isoform X3 [Culicoides brevitarsis]|uniref:patronin isoform X3 n=1 Tax=Culicoides brevitarsis TaxID=469753 RepID=UPI00307B56A8
MDTQDAVFAKQRACMKWILSKAYNNRVPDNLKEPFYRDHEGKEHLQPQIVVGLGNASLYCQVLANLYSDPNYQNRNHFSILQTLSRKGVHVHEIGDVQLTETVLIQTNPLKINAHMSVIEALMVLYAKEIASGDRVASAIARITGAQLVDTKNYEQAFLHWVQHVCAALKKRIDQELEIDGYDENGQRLQSPEIPPLRDFKDLCDGVCLAYLISFYCPKIVPWTSVRIKYLPIVEDSIHNVLLVSNFSQKYLPYSVFHMTPEDISYMRGTMKYNLLVLLADLFNLFEIHPAKCVCYPEMGQQESASGSKVVNEHGIVTKRSAFVIQQITQIPDLRPGLDSPTSTNRPPFQVVRSPSGTQLKRPTPPREAPDQSVDDGFVVHRSKGVPTLSSMNEPLMPARIRQAKEKSNNDSKADERGRRSRRNSFSEESQLTIENFGGSQDQINLIGRFDRGGSVGDDRVRRISNTSAPPVQNFPLEQLQPVRSSLSDARSTLQLGYDTDSGSEKQDKDDEKTPALRRQTSVDNVNRSPAVTAMRQHSRDNIDGEISRVKQMAAVYGANDSYEKPAAGKATFATLANPTTWQQQTVHHQHSEDIDDVQPYVDASKLSTIRLKLEEKRRHIEAEKRKLEAAVSKYQQKVGKAAFLQAINKGKGESTSQDESRASKDSSLSSNKTEEDSNASSSKPERPCSLQDITGDPLEARWDIQIDTKRTPDLDQMDIEQYTQSIAMMNTNLHDIQSDIQRLASQQNQIQAQTIQAQQLMHAQQIANILSQQQYGSQVNISNSGYRPLNSSFGSSPHLSQSPQYNTRPPSRDHHQMQTIQYVNDQGQYVNNSQPSYPVYARENSQTQLIQNNQFSNQYQTYHQDSNHYRDPYSGYQQQQQQPEQQSNNTFYLHDQQQAPPQPTQRRTWAQSAQMQRQQQEQMQQQQSQPEMTTWSQNHNKIDSRTWKSTPSNSSSNDSGKGSGGFMLHQQNGGNGDPEQSYQNLFPVHANSPQHRQHRQISQMMSNEYNRVDNRMQTPPDDVMMAPQSISFIADEDGGEVDEIPVSKPAIRPRTAPFNQHQVHQEQQRESTPPANSTKLELNLAKLNITSGNRTYRIPSPTRPAINPNSFQNPQEDTSEKGFYISFDNEQPKRPKPPLRTKRSPKKDKDFDNKEKLESKQASNDYSNNSSEKEQIEEPIARRNFGSHQASPPASVPQYIQQPPVPADRRHLEDLTNQSSQMNNIIHNNSYQQQMQNNNNNNAPKESKAIIIGPESGLDPNSVDEMERKKEKIMLLSLQRRQQQEEAKARKEIEAMQRREREREKEDEKERKKLEQAARRAAILEQHKLKKAIEEAEREGKTLDKADLMLQQKLQQQMPKLRPQKVVRPRPKTIHVESGSVDLSEASSMSSRGKRGSNTNLTGVGLHSNSNSNSNTMRRDYYRGSQDSLAMREPVAERGRTLSRIQIAKAGANFRGRKSNSLMNLCDSDSGLGRATPPRRAPSPGMGPGARHLPSPSGPGSLPPGLMTKRRIFDDGSSDISSAASSMLEYSGPRLYKQPATKSNRGIILNAVEYCVFPGAVNREAKQKVLEKIARAEAKHFLVLFRDAGCQFRALYSYYPENEQIIKLYGTGPSQVDDVMFDKFFKYNSGGKCFAQVHTKHLTVTIDAFTIHNSLWQGKKVALPSKKDMALVI